MPIYLYIISSRTQLHGTIRRAFFVLLSTVWLKIAHWFRRVRFVFFGWIWVCIWRARLNTAGIVLTRRCCLSAAAISISRFFFAQRVAAIAIWNHAIFAGSHYVCLCVWWNMHQVDTELCGHADTCSIHFAHRVFSCYRAHLLITKWVGEHSNWPSVHTTECSNVTTIRSAQYGIWEYVLSFYGWQNQPHH